MNNSVHRVLTTAIVTCLSVAALAADQGRAGTQPVGIDKTNAQFGPNNRWAFSHIREIYPTALIENNPAYVSPLAGTPKHPSDVTINFRGKETSLDSLAKKNYIDAIAVYKNEELLVEGYYGEQKRSRPHLMMSMTKSVTAVLVAKYADQGLIDVNKTVAEYLPELASSGWGPDTLRTVWDMRDGADYSEVYGDLNSTVWRHSCASNWVEVKDCVKGTMRSSYEFLPTIKRNESIVGEFHYKSASTDVLAWVLERVTGKSFVQLVSEDLWQPMGAESPADITVDKDGFGWASGGMSATLRDLTRFGVMALNRGKVGDTQLFPAAHFDDVMDHPADSNWPYGESAKGWKPYYRSFWWGVGNGDKDFEAVGINGQTIRVVPNDRMVIVTLSSWPDADGETIDGYTAFEDIFEALKVKYR
ncbi:MAG: serine hydrolase [Pseudomonadota bacterium]